MPRHFSSTICLVLLGLAALCLPAGHSAASALICPQIPAPPILDGRLDDWQPLPGAAVNSQEAWQNAAAAFAEYGGAQDLSAEIRIAWDNSALYLALDSPDVLLPFTPRWSQSPTCRTLPDPLTDSSTSGLPM